MRGGPLLDRLVVQEAKDKIALTRQRRWSAFVHQTASDEELVALRRSTWNGLPFGASAWVDQLADRLGLDLTIRPRGRPRKPTDGDRVEPAAGPRSSSSRNGRGEPMVSGTTSADPSGSPSASSTSRP